MLKGFRDFLMRGNVVDLAVAVIIGAAFTPIVTTLTDGVIMQIVAAIVGQPDFSSLSFAIGDAEIMYGALLTAIINFVLIAAVLYFVVVTPMNKAQSLFNKPSEEEEQTLTKDQELLIEIRDALRRQA